MRNQVLDRLADTERPLVVCGVVALVTLSRNVYYVQRNKNQILRH